MSKLFLSILIILSFIRSENLILSPKFQTQYFSTGSIYNYNNNIASYLQNIDLTLQKKSEKLFLISTFNFIISQNIIEDLSFINPNFSFENSRGFQNNNNRWYQSSTTEIKYNLEKLSGYFGKKKCHWGEGNSSLFISKNTPSFPQFGFVWRLSKKLSFEYFYGNLSSNIKDTTSSSNLYNNVGKRDIYYIRSIAAHKFELNITKNLKFNGMESVIFGNRLIDYTYLIPFIPFWSAQAYNGDIDNLQLMGEISYTKNHNKIYSSLFIDEWRPEWTFDKINRNWFGCQFGIKTNNLLKKNDQILVEYTWTDHRIYRHRFPINDSYSHGYSLGFWAGPHAEEVLFKFKIPIKDYIINSSFISMKRGELTEKMLNNQYIENKDIIKYHRYSNFYESRKIFSIKVEKYILNKYNIYLENQIIHWNNPGFNPYIPDLENTQIKKLSFNIGFIFLTDFILA